MAFDDSTPRQENKPTIEEFPIENLFQAYRHLNNDFKLNPYRRNPIKVVKANPLKYIVEPNSGMTGDNLESVLNYISPEYYSHVIELHENGGLERCVIDANNPEDVDIALAHFLDTLEIKIKSISGHFGMSENFKESPERQRDIRSIREAISLVDLDVNPIHQLVGKDLASKITDLTYLFKKILSNDAYQNLKQFLISGSYVNYDISVDMLENLDHYILRKASELKPCVAAVQCRDKLYLVLENNNLLVVKKNGYIEERQVLINVSNLRRSIESSKRLPHSYLELLTED